MKDNIALDTARVAIGMMNLQELRATIDIIADHIEAKAERHRIAIEQAIADAMEEGFDVTFHVEGDSNYCVMMHDSDRSMRVLVD